MVLFLDLVAKHGRFDLATHILSSDDLECTFAKLKTFCSDRQPGPVRVLSTLKILMLSKHHGIHISKNVPQPECEDNDIDLPDLIDQVLKENASTVNDMAIADAAEEEARLAQIHQRYANDNMDQNNLENFDFEIDDNYDESEIFDEFEGSNLNEALNYKFENLGRIKMKRPNFFENYYIELHRFLNNHDIEFDIGELKKQMKKRAYDKIKEFKAENVDQNVMRNLKNRARRNQRNNPLPEVDQNANVLTQEPEKVAQEPSEPPQKKRKQTKPRSKSKTGKK